ncbi:MAG TPA: anti-sigma factor [Rectinemataceae bacterium]|nr:anti-sigma factor [Rectinemataceae bacterium]
MTDHGEIADLLPGLALGCLDPEEESLAREHLAGCAQCRAELASMRDVVGELAVTVPCQEPPPGLEARIMAGLPRSRSPRRATFLLAAAAVLIVVLAAGNLVQWQRSQTGLSRRDAGGLLTIALAGSGASAAAFGTVVLDPEDNEGVLAVRGLGALDASRAYQLWLLKGERRASGGVFVVDEHGYGSLLLEVPSEFRGFDAFLVTSEPKGGSPSPTGSPVMKGRR